MSNSSLAVPQPQLKALRSDEVTIQVAIMAGLLAALLGITGWWDASFFSPFSLRSMLRDTAISSLYALGEAVVIIAGGIDLSVGSMMCFLGVLLVLLLNDGGLPFYSAAAIVGVVALAVGATHGLLVCRLKLQPFLVTLCSLLIFRGLARVMTHDRTVSYSVAEEPMLRNLASGTLLGVPLPVIILLSALALLCGFMHLTVPGRYMYAVGSNLEAARYSGLRINWLRVSSYMICSLFVAVAAILEVGDVGSVPPSSAGTAYEMYAITGAVLGGCALRGGRGSLVGVVVGMAVLRVVKSTIIFLNISTYWTFAITGIVLLAAVAIDSLVRNRSTQRF